MNKVKSSAPGKLMLFGEHAVVYGYPCIVTSIDSKIYVEVMESSELKIDAPGVKDLSFVMETLKLFCKKYKVNDRLFIKTYSDDNFKYGLGSSSAVTVALINALSDFYKINISKKEKFEIGYKTVKNVQGVGSGFDVASAVFGGTIYFIEGGKVIEPLTIPKLNLVVGYSGVKAKTSEIVKNLKPDFKIFDQIKQIVEEARINLVSRDWKTVGELMNQNHKLLQELGVSTDKLDAMCLAANQAGAYGAKLSGAGGGDCMIALVSDDKIKEVESAITDVGGEIVKVEINI